MTNLLLAVVTSIVLYIPVNMAGAGEQTPVTTTVVHKTATTTSTTLVAPYIIAMWEKVATCETGGRWWRNAPTFDGGLGISRVNWQYYAPDNFPDAPHLASKEQQVYVARIIQASGGVPNYVPDQAGGCHAW